MGVNAICGGLNPESKQAGYHAESYYESVRRQSGDCDRIVINTGFTFEQVSLIKMYIFFAKHNICGNTRRFDPSYEMAESWRRLSSKRKSEVQPHDITLLKHELLEIKYVTSGLSQEDAHNMAQSRYNYRDESKMFYRKFGFNI